MIELNIIEPSRCDKALGEFNCFPDIYCKTTSDKFAEFNESSCHLDLTFKNTVNYHSSVELF